MEFTNFQDYFKENNPLISDVVTYHLRLEALLEMMLKKLTPNPNHKKIEEKTFAQKAKAVFNHNLVNESLFEVVRKLNMIESVNKTV